MGITKKEKKKLGKGKQVISHKRYLAGEDMAKNYIIPIVWQMRGFIEIDAESLEEAIITVKNNDDITIPIDAKYVEGSCQIEMDDTDCIEMYTEAYESENLGYIPQKYGVREN